MSQVSTTKRHVASSSMIGEVALVGETLETVLTLMRFGSSVCVHMARVMILLSKLL